MEDTTTTFSFDDQDDDKTLFLNGKQRLKYFIDNKPGLSVSAKPDRAQSSLRRLLARIISR